MKQAEIGTDFWYTEDGDCLCGDCARSQGIDPDDPASGFEEMTAELAGETNLDLGDGFRVACERCGSIAPATPPGPPEWRVRCLYCGSVEYFHDREEAKHRSPWCNIARPMERNPRFRPAD